MSRKMQRSLWRDEHRRRSLENSGVDAWKAHQFDSQNEMAMEQEVGGDEQGPPSRTRARVKRKLQDPVSTKTQSKQRTGELKEVGGINQTPITPQLQKRKGELKEVGGINQTPITPQLQKRKGELKEVGEINQAPITPQLQKKKGELKEVGGINQGPITPQLQKRKGELKEVGGINQAPITPQLQKGRGKPNYKDHSDNSDQALVAKTKESPKRNYHATCTAQPSVASSMPSMPEKHILELILDILQRRDTYEIFAEPVDPKEVEDYYEIIEEPMDFGTMRAKLHEGMYKTLEQFEHDVFLISGNAMHFNSSATIFFRQARAIHELSKKVFHVLKTDPENFILEFSGTRRRSGRRPQGEARDLNFKSCPRLSTNVRPGSVKIDASSKGTPCSSGPSIFRRSIIGNPGVGSTASRVDIRDYDLFSGNRDGRTSSSAEVDKRCTYRPWKFFHNEDDSIVPKITSDPKPLILVNQRDLSYSESLMMFVKDLGPTAQMIAKRKLQGLSGYAPSCQTPRSDSWVQAPTPQISSTFPFAQIKPSTQDTVSTTSTSQKLISDVIDLTDADDGEKSCYTSDRVGNLSAPGVEVPPNDEGLCTRDEMNVPNVSRRDKVTQNRSSEIQLGSYSSNTDAFNNSGTKSTAMTLPLSSETSQTDVSEFKLRNQNISSSSWLSQISGVSSLSQANGSTHSLESNRVVPSATRFAFDLPFLKSQLNQMNCIGQDRFLQPKPQRGFGTEGSLFDRRGNKMSLNYTHHAEPSTRPLLNSRSRSTSLDIPASDLALQL